MLKKNIESHTKSIQRSPALKGSNSIKPGVVFSSGIPNFLESINEIPNISPVNIKVATSPPIAQAQSLLVNFFNLNLSNKALNDSALPSFFANAYATENIGIKMRKPVINQLMAGCIPAVLLRYGVR